MSIKDALSEYAQGRADERADVLRALSKGKMSKKLEGYIQFIKLGKHVDAGNLAAHVAVSFMDHLLGNLFKTPPKAKP